MNKIDYKRRLVLLKVFTSSHISQNKPHIIFLESPSQSSALIIVEWLAMH